MKISSLTQKCALFGLVLSMLLGTNRQAWSAPQPQDAPPPPPALIPLSPAPSSDFPKPQATPKPPKNALPAPVPSPPSKKGHAQAHIGQLQIRSRQATYDIERHVSIFKGQVYVRTAEYQLWADEVEISTKGGNNQQVVATSLPGHWVYVQQHEPGSLPITKVRGKQITYQAKTDTLWVVGDARVDRFVCQKLVDTLSGQKIIYQPKENRYNVQGSAQAPAFTAISSSQTLKTLEKQCLKH